jgi:DNA-binding transcriptional MocR family regulator
MRAASASELVSEIEAAVATGALAAEQPLPSVRRLALEVGLSPATVAAAIAELRRRGVVISEPRRGTRIGARPPIGSTSPALPVPAGARELARGNPDPALLPDLQAALARVALPTRLYGEPQMLAELVELARTHLRADGVSAEHVCLTSGALDAIERVFAAQLRCGDRIAVENPGYAALFDLARAYGLALEPVAVDRRGMLPDQLQRALQRGARAVVITPRGQNPTGAALDAARAAELRAVLERFPGVLTVEDDHLGPVAGVDLHPLQRAPIDPRRRWAATRSVAKALGPDLRLAVLAGDAQTIARVQGRQQCGPGWVSHILQSLVLALWRDPQTGALIERARATYTRRREQLIACLAREGVHAHGASGLNVWIPVAEEASVIAALLQRGWALAPGAPYCLPKAAPGVRVTIATLTEQEAARLAHDVAVALAPSALSRAG